MHGFGDSIHARVLHLSGGDMTAQLAHRELRNRSAEILRDVAAGASYEPLDDLRGDR